MSVNSLQSVSGSGSMVNADKKRVVAQEAEDVQTNVTVSTQVVEMAPNRGDFERGLWKLNNATNNVQTQLKKYWNETRRQEINLQRDQISNLQSAFNFDLTCVNELTLKLNEHSQKQGAKQREIHEMEADLTYKTLSLAEEKLSMAENRYKRQNFASVREEKLQVAEIDRIKRNVLKLAKYLPLIEERKHLELTIKDLRQEIRLIRSKMRGYRDLMNDCRKKIRDLKTPYIGMKKKLYELNEDRRSMIKQYEKDRQNYTLWAQQHRGVATFPTAMLYGESIDNFEPFAEQKKTCAKLLRYLRNLKRKCEPVSTSESIAPSNSDAESSADEFPDSFKMLKLGNSDTSLSNDAAINYSKKKYVKKYVKKTLPITHSIDYIRLFSDIEVEFPKTYAELDESISKVEEVLNFYNDQTNLERLEELERADSPFSSMISLNGSDLMDTSYLSPRSESSLSSFVIADESAQREEATTIGDESNLNFHFPRLRQLDGTRH